MTKDPLPPLPWLRAFEAAARLSSFTKAGDELGLTQAAVSQHMRHLEARIGASLFDRRRRGVTLTPLGAAYLPHVQMAFAGLRRSTSEIFGSRRGEMVVLRSPISFAALWLAPRLRLLRQSHPHLAVRILTIHTPADYRPDEPDLDVRFGLGEWTGRSAYRLTVERLTPVCASHAAEDAWTTRLPLLSVEGPREMWPDWFALAGMPFSPASAHRFDSFIAALEAAKAGAGLLLGSRPLVDGALSTGSLVRLSDVELPSASGHFVSHAAGAMLSPAQRAFLDWLLAEVSNAAPPLRDVSRPLVSTIND